MLNTIANVRLAATLTAAFAGDGYREHYFAPSWLGTTARFLLFLTDIRVRRATGLVLQQGDCVALVGLPPHSTLRKADLGIAVALAIRMQGEPYNARWAELWTEVAREQQGATSAYLSAIACPASQRGIGNGSLLLQRVKDAAAERGLDLTLECSTQELVRWYTLRGFVLLGEHALSPTFAVYQMIACRNTAVAAAQVNPANEGHEPSLM